MISIDGKGEITIVISSNNGFIINTSKKVYTNTSQDSINIRMQPLTKVFTAVSIDETMIIVREQLEALTM